LGGCLANTIISVLQFGLLNPAPEHRTDFIHNGCAFRKAFRTVSASTRTIRTDSTSASTQVPHSIQIQTQRFAQLSQFTQLSHSTGRISSHFHDSLNSNSHISLEMVQDSVNLIACLSLPRLAVAGLHLLSTGLGKNIFFLMTFFPYLSDVYFSFTHFRRSTPRYGYIDSNDRTNRLNKFYCI
jgi:hypothetical protein